MSQQKFKKFEDIGIKDPEGFNIQDTKYNFTGEEEEEINSESEYDSDDNFIDDETSSNKDETESISSEQSERTEQSETEEDCTPLHRIFTKKKKSKKVELSNIKILQEEKDFVSED